VNAELNNEFTAQPEDDHEPFRPEIEEFIARYFAGLRRLQEMRAAEACRRRENQSRLTILNRARKSVWSREVNPTLTEPTIHSADLYKLRDAHLSVNEYGALCLNSYNMFIADVDQNLDRGTLLGNYPSESAIEQIFDSIAFMDSFMNTRFHTESYRIYATHSGYRIICTSETIRATPASLTLLRFFGADPLYATMCDRDRCYCARLTPKPYRALKRDDVLEVDEMQIAYDIIDDFHACTLLGHFRNGVGWYAGADDEIIHTDLVEQLRVHDDLSLQVKENATLA